MLRKIILTWWHSTILLTILLGDHGTTALHDWAHQHRTRTKLETYNLSKSSMKTKYFFWMAVLASMGQRLPKCLRHKWYHQYLTPWLWVGGSDMVILVIKTLQTFRGQNAHEDTKNGKCRDNKRNCISTSTLENQDELKNRGNENYSRIVAAHNAVPFCDPKEIFDSFR